MKGKVLLFVSREESEPVWIEVDGELAELLLGAAHSGHVKTCAG